MSSLNIRNAADRNTLETAGYTWVTVAPRGEQIGTVRSKHRTFEAASSAAKNLDRTIVEVRESGSF